MTRHDTVSQLTLSKHRAESIRVEDWAPLRRGIVDEGARRENGERSLCEPETVSRTRFTPAGGVRRHAPGTPTARIYQRGRSPMQSGQVRESTWLLTFEPQHRTEIDFLMGWTSSRDTLQQVELRFTTLDEAVAFAERRELRHVVEVPRRHKVQPKSYADNFRHDRLLPWTH